MKSKSFNCIIVCCAGLFILILISCNQYKKNKSHKGTLNSSIKAGKKLAVKYCGSCHQLPDPSLIDAKSWEDDVLPEMGPRLGIFFYGDKEYPSYRNDLNIENYYPSQQVLSYVDWQHIIDYYTATSPDSLLPSKKSTEIKISNALFQPVKPALYYNTPAVSFIRFQPEQKIIMCDAFLKKMFVFNKDLQLTGSTKTPGPVTDIIIDSDELTLCNTGLLNPNNGKFGSIESISGTDSSNKKILFKNLMRPVQVVQADVNNDGKKDYVVCEFGNLLGALSWLEKTDTGYVRHIIRAVPGAIKTYITDYNHDGSPDIWTLFSQGDEGVFLFANKGNGTFDTKEVLRFPPSYGSSSFELDDFNKDGFPDIIYTCGDNADYSPVLKPYHGVYIFINDGKNSFIQKYFYPINGCYKAIAKDFDNDGDLDIATISFFADYAHKPEEGFIYFKNNGTFNFQPYSLTAAKYGRWLTMDAGDFDGDGKTDLILGNFSPAAIMMQSAIDWTKQPPFLVLKNLQ